MPSTRRVLAASIALAAVLAPVLAATAMPAVDPGTGLRPSLEPAPQPQPPPAQPPSNATNATTIPGFGNGTNTHYHGNVGDQGLGAVWASVFHGVPQLAVAADLDADGTLDAVLGTDLSVTVVSGATGDLLWARHLGSTVTSLFVFDGDGKDGPEVGFSTLWEAQTPRVGVLDGARGEVQWEHLGQQPFLTAAAASDGPGSDVLAVDTSGRHVRLAAATGEPVWEVEVDLLPDDPTNGAATGIVHTNLGHHLAKAADLNGDGTTDTVSVGNHQYVLNLNRYAIVQAVDGATGERLWLHNVGGDPNTVSQALVHDIEPLDAQGDGSADVAVSFLVVRVPLLGVPLIYWEQGIRIIKGDSPTVGVPIGAREFVTPVVPVDAYPDLDHVDVDGDGRDEVAALREFLPNGLLGSDSVTYERYAMPIGSPTTGTLLLVSDVTIGAGDVGRISAFDLDGDGGRDHGVTRVLDGNASWTVVRADGEVLGPFDTERIPVQAVASLGGRLAVATQSALQLRPAAALAQVERSMPLRGAPLLLRMADADEDSTPDMHVLASDGAVHVIDGVTGIPLRSVTVGRGVSDFGLAQVDGSPVPDIIAVREDAMGASSFPYYAPAIEAWDGETGRAIHARAFGFDYRVLRQGALWFDGDGDGGRDLLSTWDWAADTLSAVDGLTGEDLWAGKHDLGTTTVTPGGWLHGATVRLDEVGEDLLLASSEGVLVVDGASGKQRGWHPVDSNGGLASGRGPVTCMGGVDGDGDGAQSLVFVQSGPVGDLARIQADGAWRNLDWVPDESDVVRCELTPVADGDGGEDLLVTMVWVEDFGAGAVWARVARYDAAGDAWLWDDVQRRPDVEAEAYFPFGVDGDRGDDSRVYLAWQDHVYALSWLNGSLLGEFTVNGPFVTQGSFVELDGVAPAEAVVLAADGLLWALAEDRGLVAARLAQKAADDGKPSNYGSGSTFEAPPLPTPPAKKKGLIPAPPVAALALALAGAAGWRARRGNR